jgi:hypothetical protein
MFLDPQRAFNSDWRRYLWSLIAWQCCSPRASELLLHSVDGVISGLAVEELQLLDTSQADSRICLAAAGQLAWTDSFTKTLRLKIGQTASTPRSDAPRLSLSYAYLDSCGVMGKISPPRHLGYQIDVGTRIMCPRLSIAIRPIYDHSRCRVGAWASSFLFLVSINAFAILVAHLGQVVYTSL